MKNHRSRNFCTYPFVRTPRRLNDKIMNIDEHQRAHNERIQYTSALRERMKKKCGVSSAHESFAPVGGVNAKFKVAIRLNPCVRLPLKMSFVYKGERLLCARSSCTHASKKLFIFYLTISSFVKQGLCLAWVSSYSFYMLYDCSVRIKGTASEHTYRHIRRSNFNYQYII